MVRRSKQMREKQFSLLLTPASKVPQRISEAERKEGRKTWRKTNLHPLGPQAKKYPKTQTTTTTTNPLPQIKKEREREKKTMGKELHSGCSASRDLCSATWILCFRGVYLETSLSTTRTVTALPSFSLFLLPSLYSSPPLEQNTIQNRAVSAGSLPPPIVTPSLLSTGMEINITAIYYRWIFLNYYGFSA